MFRLWGRIFKSGHMLEDCVICNDSSMTRTKKIFSALEDVVHEFNLPVPIWLDSNIADFKRTSKTRFGQDSFIESIEFDFLEIQVIEEDSEY